MPAGEEIDFMKSLPLKDVWGVGGKTRERLIAAGLTTVPQIFNSSEHLLQSILGNERVKGKTVSVKIRYNDFTTVSVQSTGVVVNDTQDLFERAKELFYKKFDNKTPIRLLGLCIMNIESDIPEVQTELFYSEKNVKKRKIEETMYALTKKEGKNILKPARLLKKDKDDFE